MATHPHDEGFLPVQGGRIWYTVIDSGGRGLPLLCLHGGPGATHDYLEPLEQLASERPVVFYDQLGSGKSERPDDASLWTVERFVAELATVREALGLEHLHLLGQSWGCMLAVEYLRRHGTDGVAGLILSAPYLSTARWVEDQWAYIAALPAETRAAIDRCERTGDFDNPDYAAAMAEFYRRHLCRLDPWPDCLQRTFAQMGLPVYQHMWGPSEFTVTGTLSGHEVGGLEALDLPVLLTCGRFDEAAPATVDWFSQRLPRARTVVFEDASHSHHLEKTEEYLAAVGAFLRENDGQAPETPPGTAAYSIGRPTLDVWRGMSR